MTASDPSRVVPEPDLVLAGAAVLADLATYVGRAKRVDPDGAARLVGHGDLLAVYVSPVHGGGGPTVLGLRTLALASPSGLDVTVPLATLTDRLARATVVPGAGTGSGQVPASERPVPGEVPASAQPVRLAVPPVLATGASWAGVSPPRRGWEAVGLVEAGLLTRVAAAGVAEVAAGAPSGSGGQAVARLRAGVWGRPLVDADNGSAGGPPGSPWTGAPAGVAFVAEALGFVDGAEPAALYVAGPWCRLTTSRGHVLARRPALG